MNDVYPASNVTDIGSPEPVHIGLGLRYHNIHRGRSTRQRLCDVGRAHDEGFGYIRVALGHLVLPSAVSPRASRAVSAVQRVALVATKFASGAPRLHHCATCGRINNAVVQKRQRLAFGTLAAS